MLVELASNWLGLLIDNILYVKCNEKATNACLDLTYSLYGNFSSFLVENFAGTCWTEDRWLIHQRDLTTGQLRVTATIVTKGIIELRLHEQNRTHEGWSSCAFSLFRSWFYVSCVSLRYYYSLEFRKEISYHSSPRLWRGTLNSSLPSLFSPMGKSLQCSVSSEGECFLFVETAFDGVAIYTVEHSPCSVISRPNKELGCI